MNKQQAYDLIRQAVRKLSADAETHEVLQKALDILVEPQTGESETVDSTEKTP